MYALKTICEILRSLKLFPNQTVFYNCLFGMTAQAEDSNEQTNLISSTSEYFPAEHIRQMKEALEVSYRDQVTLADKSSLSTTFYEYVTGNTKDKERDLYYPSLSGDVIPQEKSNINAVIKGHRNIPAVWVKKYETAHGLADIMSFTVPLAIVIQYLLVFSSNGVSKYRMDTPAVFSKYPDYTEYFSYGEGIFAEISDKIKEKDLYTGEIKKLVDQGIHSLVDVSTIIFYAIMQQCGLKGKLSYDKMMVGDMSHGFSDEDLPKQFEIYSRYVNCYGAKNIDRLHALERYAENNIYCACELGGIYYYGDFFYAGENKCYIERDYSRAAKYFQACCSKPLLPKGCWSFAHMIFLKIFNLDDATRLSKAEEYFKLCGNYGPAKNSLGLLEKERGDILLKEYVEDKNTPFDSIDGKIRDKILEHYTLFFEYTSEAAKEEWLYGYNNQYAFLADKKYESIIPFLESVLSKYNIGKYSMLKKSVEMKNPWAMDKFAFVLLSGEAGIDETPDIKDYARNLLEAAHKMNYARATYHLAVYFYKEEPERYYQLIKAAADAGHSDARLELEHIEEEKRKIKWTL